MQIQGINIYRDQIFGRQLHADSHKQLVLFESGGCDIAITIADGLSAAAVNDNAIPLIKLLIPVLQQANLRIAPLCLVEQGGCSGR